MGKYRDHRSPRRGYGEDQFSSPERPVEPVRRSECVGSRPLRRTGGDTLPSLGLTDTVMLFLQVAARPTLIIGD